MNKKYLPSEQFIARVIIIVIIITVVFGMYELVKFIKNKVTKKDAPIQLVIGDIIQKDSNNNGIADWEEYLWGLNPKKNGESNKEFITAKKNALVQSGDMTTASGTPTDNDLLSQEFFAAIVSLQMNGQLDDASMKSISEAVGKNAIATPIPDIYTMNMLTLEDDSPSAKETYHNALSNLVTKYKDADIGSELTFIAQGLSSNDPSALYAAKTVGDAYQSFGKDLIAIPVPRSLSATVLNTANNYDKVGQSIYGLTQILDDQLVGMRAIINYKNYSDALASDLEKIYGALQ